MDHSGFVSDPPPIVGFRQDRLGARLVTLINVMRLSRSFGVAGRYLWLSQPDGPYPEITDPAELFAPEFIERWITVVDAPPTDLAQRENCTVAMRVTNRATFAGNLSEGRRYWTEDGFTVLHLIDESPGAALTAFREAFAEIAFSATVAAHLARLANALGAQAAALHVRRGDLISDNHWSRTSWPSKFVPDEFYAAAAARITGPVAAFTDTPDALAHLIATQPGAENIRPALDLVDLGDCTHAQRDLLELLILGSVKTIYAPVQSAFSTAAALLGGARIVPLPPGLGPGRIAAPYDRLVERTLRGPAAFYSPGDFAQSLHYAARHAGARPEGSALLDLLEGLDPTLFERHPFLSIIGAQLAMAQGRNDAFQAFTARMGGDADGVWSRDKAFVGILRLVEEGRQDPAGEGFTGAVATDLFGLGATNSQSPLIQGVLAIALEQQAFRDLLLIEADEVPYLTQPADGSDKALSWLFGDRPELAAPLWLVLADWPELVRRGRGLSQLKTHPPLRLRLLAMGHDIRNPEDAAALTRPLPQDRGARLMLGRMAATLSMFGRFKMALAILEPLLEAEPTAANLKRLGDVLAATGREARASGYYARALSLAPAGSALNLSLAQRLAAEGRHRNALTHIAMARAAHPMWGLPEQIERDIRRQKNAERSGRS